MHKILKCFWLLLIYGAYSGLQSKDIELPKMYPLIVERLLFFKRENFKVFFGGPIDSKIKGVKWLMPIVFEDDSYKTRAVYEAAFVNCDLKDAHDAEIIFVSVSDINIKLKNTLSQDYHVFSSLITGKYKEGKYIVVRCTDFANVYYPDIFVFSEYGETRLSDKADITAFLHAQFKTSDTYTEYYRGEALHEIKFKDEHTIIYKPFLVHINFEGKVHPFFVEKRIKKDDIWSVYYIISKTDPALEFSNISGIVDLRLDSGCLSGQVYGDEACDCLDQLHSGLKQFAEDPSSCGIIIHIPGHDGRGFGTAPKAETEIYKRGGKGRIHSTVALDTVTAAKLLYGVDTYDLRSFDGAAKIVKAMGITKVLLLTDNVDKVSTLQSCDIEVVRQKTNTNKASCINHINAKKNSPLYFSE